ncbi:MAG: sensor domain-containing diguanylate cyclase [Chloroflexi bacterium]|nr:sensor domain-containing diguanylate cyclase [Chloroflexota bacterium]
MKLIKVLHVNNETLVMFGAGSEEELLNNLDMIFRDEMRHHFQTELLALWNNESSWAGEGINYTLKDTPLNIRLQWRILPECIKTWKCVMVAIEDITPLKMAEARFQHLFNYAPISLWEEDYRSLKKLFNELREQGVTDLRKHLTEYPGLVNRFMGLIRVLNVNLKTLELFGAPSKEILLSDLNKVFRDDMRQHFMNELVDMWNGKTAYEYEGINYSLTGEPINVHLDWRLMPGHEKDFSWVLVAIQDITARKKAEEYLRYLGTHDVMTGLFNRAYFEEQILKLAGTKDEISFIMADLNGLKTINDTSGHQAGDGMIRRAAEVLKTVFDQGEVVARIGGDEFVVIVQRHPFLHETVERIHSLIMLNNKYYQGPELSISLGCATRKNNEPLEKTLSRADKAMYEDKSAYYKDDGQERRMSAT